MAPSAVTDLEVIAGAPGSVTLAFTTPDDSKAKSGVRSYQVRAEDFPAASDGWADWPVVLTADTEGQAGEADTLVVSGLTAGESYVIRVAASDGAGNQGLPSNAVVATADDTHDTTAPSAVTDLALWSSTDSTLSVVWTAPGDDGDLGRAAGYSVRYGTEPLTELNWESAPEANADAPGDPGDRDRADIMNLEAGMTYHVAVRTTDEAGNWSPISNDLTAAATRQDTWYIKPDGSGDLPTIQEAIDAARYGDTILLAAGRYTWTNQQTEQVNSYHEYGMLMIFREVDGFHILGEAGPEQTIIDAEGKNRVIWVMGYNDNVVIEGVTLMNGNSLESDFGYGGGGGIQMHLTSTNFRNCIVRDNKAVFGGGILMAGQCAARITDCQILNNEAEYGAGVYGIKSSPVSIFTRCVVSGNMASHTGGGVVSDTTAIELRDCLFVNNRAAVKAGATIFARSHPSIVEGCTFVNNRAPSGAVATVTVAATVTFTRNIFASNRGGVAFFEENGSNLSIGCSDFYDNSSGDGLPPGAADLGGNFSANPLFVGNGDYRLKGGSPCLPGSHPDGDDCGLIGAYGGN